MSQFYLHSPKKHYYYKARSESLHSTCNVIWFRNSSFLYVSVDPQRKKKEKKKREILTKIIPKLKNLQILYTKTKCTYAMRLVYYSEKKRILFTFSFEHTNKKEMLLKTLTGLTPIVLTGDMIIIIYIFFLRFRFQNKKIK